MELTYGEMRSNAMKIHDEAIKDRVLRGIEILNKHFGPDWPDLIDEDRFDISSGRACVLGQVYANAPYDEAAFAKYGDKFGYGDFDDPVKAWAVMDGYDRGKAILNADVATTPSRFGFDAYDEEWAELQEAWEMVFGVVEAPMAS